MFSAVQETRHATEENYRRHYVLENEKVVFALAGPCEGSED